MEGKKEPIGMLDLMIRPGFCVKENIITDVNAAARSLLLAPGTDVRELLLTGREEYAAFREGCLYLKLNLSPSGCGASVIAAEGCHVFILDQESDDSELRCLALAARELREPLTSILISAERILPSADPEQAARLNRGLHQLLRMVGNMSDAGRSAACSQQEMLDLAALFQELSEKAQSLLAHSGIRLTFRGLSQPVLTLADGAQLERAVLNILSNAAKFTPAGGTVEMRLTQRGRMLQLQIQDSGSGIAQQIRSSLFHRYLRQPGIEDSRWGLGLGMVLIRSAAASHGGTVLIDSPTGTGTRVTMTLAIRQSAEATLRSPILRVDYAGERDHGLLELADCLPAQLYTQ